MASTSTKAAAVKPVLTPSIILKGHGTLIQSISYFPDGQRMISGSRDRTTRQWDLKAGKEIEEARGVCERSIYAAAVSRDSRWVVTCGGDGDRGELKACEVETGIVKTFKGHSDQISCIDIFADNTQLASGSHDKTVQIWNLDTGKLVAGPFKSEDWVGAVRFCTDSKKFAVKSNTGRCLEVWDVGSQKLDVRLGKVSGTGVAFSPVFWTHKNKTIIATFEFTTDSADLYDNAKTIYEFDVSTLETVGAPFEGHTKIIGGLAFSFDGALLVSASKDNTVKLWAFESRQLLASFDIQNILRLVLSPDSRQLAYTTYTTGDDTICICDIPPDVLAQARNTVHEKPNIDHLLHMRISSSHETTHPLLSSQSHATRRPPAGYHRPISARPMVGRPPPTDDSKQPFFFRLSKHFRFSRTNLVPVRHIRPRDALDVPATLPLPSSLSGRAATRFDHFEISSPPPPSSRIAQSLRQHLSFLMPRRSHGPPVVEVAPGRKVTRLAAAKLPEYKKVDDTRHPSSQQATVPQENDTADIDSLPDVHWCTAFLCYYSCWSHGRLRMPPRWRLERVDVPRQDDTTSSSRSGSHNGS